MDLCQIRFRPNLNFLLKLLLVALAMAIPHASNAQKSLRPHQFKAGIDGALIGAGLALGGTALYLRSQNQVNSFLSPPALNPYDVPLVERFTISRWSPTDAKVSDGLLIGSGILSVSVLINNNVRKSWAVTGLMAAETALLTASLTYTAKWGADRYRPFMYNESVPWEDRLHSDGTESFFSGHTSFSAAATFFAARVWCDHHPQHRANALVWTAAAVLPALTGIERVRAGKHFPTDVVAGYVAGSAIGYLVPVLHRSRRNDLDFSVSPAIGFSGLSAVLRF